MRQFWMVYGKGQSTPTHEHGDIHGARKEAQRLARIHSGTEFVVLEAVEGFVKSDLQAFTYRGGNREVDDEIPF
jgi:hypothetical protein